VAQEDGFSERGVAQRRQQAVGGGGIKSASAGGACIRRNCRREIREGALGERLAKLGEGHFGELRAKGGWMTVAGQGYARQHFAFQRRYESFTVAASG
jgi:hypothetical protein